MVAPFFQLKRVIESDAAMTEDLIAYNIIPLDAPAMTNAITSFPEVSLSYFIFSFDSLLLIAFIIAIVV